MLAALRLPRLLRSPTVPAADLWLEVSGLGAFVRMHWPKAIILK